MVCLFICLAFLDCVLGIVFEMLFVAIIWDLGVLYLPPGKNSFNFSRYLRSFRSLGLYNAISKQVFRTNQLTLKMTDFYKTGLFQNLFLEYVLGVLVQSRCWFTLFGLWIVICVFLDSRGWQKQNLANYSRATNTSRAEILLSVDVPPRIQGFSRLAILHYLVSSWIVFKRWFLFFSWLF